MTVDCGVFSSEKVINSLCSMSVTTISLLEKAATSYACPNCVCFDPYVFISVTSAHFSFRQITSKSWWYPSCRFLIQCLTYLPVPVSQVTFHLLQSPWRTTWQTLFLAVSLSILWDNGWVSAEDLESHSNLLDPSVGSPHPACSLTGLLTWLFLVTAVSNVLTLSL